MVFCCRAARSSTRSSRRQAESSKEEDYQAPPSSISHADREAEHRYALLHPSRTQDCCGIGINFRISEAGDLEVESLAASGPAIRTGKLRAGDQLTRVDGLFVRGMPASQIAPRVLGPAGSIVELSFKRVQGPAVLTINVTCVREPPRDQASVSPRAEATGRVSRPLAAESRASRSPAALQAEQADKQHNHDGNIHSYGKGAHSSLLTSSSSYDGFYERKTRGTSRLVSDGTRGSAGGTKWSDKDRTSTDFGLQPNGVQACEHDEESLRGRLDDTAQKHSLQDSIRGDDLDARSVERVPSDFDSPNVHDVHRTLMELAMVSASSPYAEATQREHRIQARREEGNGLGEPESQREAGRQKDSRDRKQSSVGRALDTGGTAVTGRVTAGGREAGGDWRETKSVAADWESSPVGTLGRSKNEIEPKDRSSLSSSWWRAERIES